MKTLWRNDLWKKAYAQLRNTPCCGACGSKNITRDFAALRITCRGCGQQYEIGEPRLDFVNHRGE